MPDDGSLLVLPIATTGCVSDSEVYTTSTSSLFWTLNAQGRTDAIPRPEFL